MATIKSFTDIEQSKKLAEILPIESADMHWKLGVIDTIVIDDNGDFREYRSIPAWSLAALLNIIPKHIKEYNVLRIDIAKDDFAIWYDEIGCGVNKELPDITIKSAVDACYEMIIRLNELNLL